MLTIGVSVWPRTTEEHQSLIQYSILQLQRCAHICFWLSGCGPDNTMHYTTQGQHICWTREKHNCSNDGMALGPVNTLSLDGRNPCTSGIVHPPIELSWSWRRWRRGCYSGWSTTLPYCTLLAAGRVCCTPSNFSLGYMQPPMNHIDHQLRHLLRVFLQQNCCKQCETLGPHIDVVDLSQLPGTLTLGGGIISGLQCAQ